MAKKYMRKCTKSTCKYILKYSIFLAIICMFLNASENIFSNGFAEKKYVNNSHVEKQNILRVILSSTFFLFFFFYLHSFHV